MRISREQVLMSSARLWAQRSTCTRAQVGASIVREGRVLMSGYNGAPPGLRHCDHTKCTCRPITMTIDGDFSGGQTHHDPLCGRHEGCMRAIHAEQNAINCCARWGVETADAGIYVTVSPCLSCAMSIISAGIVSVTYAKCYRDLGGIRLLGEAGILVRQYEELPASIAGEERGM